MDMTKPLSIIAILGALLTPSLQAEKPVKVFILAGQSNMQGQGVVAMDHAEYYNGGKGNLVIPKRAVVRTSREGSADGVQAADSSSHAHDELLGMTDCCPVNGRDYLTRGRSASTRRSPGAAR